MRTLARNGCPKHSACAQVSATSVGGCAWPSNLRLFDRFTWLIISTCAPKIGALRFSILAVLASIIVVRLVAMPAFAADPQPYRVDMTTTGDSEMNATLKATSDLLNLRTSAPVGPYALIGRARSDRDRLKTVLESYGYYQGQVVITIDGLALDDPTLGEELSARSKDAEAHVKITFDLGPLYHLRNIAIDGEIPEPARGALGLTTGAPAVAAAVLAAGERLQTALEDEGYAFAKVDPPIAQEIPAEHVLDVSFHVVTGAKVEIGEIRIEGLKRVRESFVRRRLLVHRGEQYGASKIEKARKDLLALGVFTAITVHVDPKPDSTGQVPITFRVRERLQHAVSLSGAYSTDLGGSAGVTWTNRNVSGTADQLTLAASVINLGGSASTGIGYDLSAKYLKPEFGHRDQSLQLAVQALNQSLQAYNQKALTFGATLTRKLSRIWTVTAGVTAEVERIGQEGFFSLTCPATGCAALTYPPEQVVGGPVCTAQSCTEEVFTTNLLTSHFTLVALPITLLYNTTGLDSPIEDPTHGMRASFSEAPTLSLGTTNAKFFISQANVAYYLDLHELGLNPDAGRSILALRAVAGVAAGAGQFSLPPDQRFYAGGSGTIRGYRYQSVGPAFPDRNPIGGTAINAGSTEFRQRIGRNLGFAVFLDAGQVSQNINPLNSTLRFGTGAGVRYYTPIGPIRLDVAVPINRLPGGDAFEIYIGLGQAF
jgi:translocation and assembly module TamA